MSISHAEELGPTGVLLFSLSEIRAEGSRQRTESWVPGVGRGC
jgi:hypothetical protein